MKLFTTTAATLILAAGGALAGSHSDGEMAGGNMGGDDMVQNTSAELMRTRDITGGTVYTMNEANDEGWTVDMTYNDVHSDWNDIGTIEDIVLSKGGEMKGIVAEIGGYLDYGDKHVMIPVDDVNLVAVDEASYAYVTRLNEEQLEELEGVDEGFWN